MNTLVFLWHLAHKKVLISGGLKRFVEVVSRGEKYGTHFTVIENSPHLYDLNGLPNYEPVKFRIPLDEYEDLPFIRLLIWIYYMVKATISGIMLALKRNFDIVMTPSGELFCTAIPTYITHALRRIPLVYVVQLTPSGLPSSEITPEYRRYRSQGFNSLMAAGLSFYAYISRLVLVKLYNKAQLIITVSESLKKQLEQYGVRRKMHVVRNGINVEEMESVIWSGPKIYDAIFVGRHTPTKGVLDLMIVWKEVVKKVPTALLVLIGYCTGDVRKLIEGRIKQYNLTENVVMMGVLPRSELVSSMKKSKLFLFLSREESFGLAIGEALACGLPVVCSNILPVQELYQTESVIRCPIGDMNCVVRKTLNLLLDEELRNRLGMKARAYVQKYRWKETAEKQFQLYYSLTR